MLALIKHISYKMKLYNIFTDFYSSSTMFASQILSQLFSISFIENSTIFCEYYSKSLNSKVFIWSKEKQKEWRRQACMNLDHLLANEE